VTNRTAVKLLGVAVAMFGFGFALVPLYDLICEVTGLNGKTGGQYSAVAEQTVDEDRMVTVQFLASNNASMAWEFRPEVRTLKVNPGRLNSTRFHVFNPAAKRMTAQAVPSVTPSRAAQYLHKTECFCFEQQQLNGGESMDMPLRFIIDSDLPADIGTVTLSYTLYDITAKAGFAANGT